MRRRFFLSVDKVPDNQIWYATIDNNAVDIKLKPETGPITSNYGFGSQLISNTSGTKCIIKTLGVITQIGAHIFADSNIVSIQMPKYVDIIRSSSFSGCAHLTHVDMPDGIVTIEYSAFENCTSLRKIQLAEDIETIGHYCFYGCSSLEEITLNENVKEIDYAAFANCSSLTVLYSRAVVPPTLDHQNISDQYIFYNTPIEKIYVPFESVSAYQTAWGWRRYENIIEGYNFD